MKSTKHLRLRLRLMEGALLLLCGVFTAAAVSTHQLLLDAANHPTSDFDLTSTHVVGTLDAARLDPAAVPLLDGNQNLSLPDGVLLTDTRLTFGSGGGVFVASNGQVGTGLNFNDEFLTDGGANVLFYGTATATAFVGDGSGLFNLPPASVDGTDISPNSVTVSGGYTTLDSTGVNTQGTVTANGDVSSGGNIGVAGVGGFYSDGLLVADYAGVYIGGIQIGYQDSQTLSLGASLQLNGLQVLPVTGSESTPSVVVLTNLPTADPGVSGQLWQSPTTHAVYVSQ